MDACLIAKAPPDTPRALLDRLVDRCRDHPECTLRLVEDPVDFAPTVRDAAQQFTRIVVAGGDGTFSLAVNALGAHLASCDLGLVPMGTGNDLARSLGLPADDPELAFLIAVTGRAQPMDLIRMSGEPPRLIANVCSAGFGGQVAQETSRRAKGRWAAGAYWMAALKTITHLQEHEARISIDGVVIEATIYGLGIANGRFVGGGATVAPDAHLDDGLADLVAVTVQPAVEIPATSINLILGRHDMTDHVLHVRGRRIGVEAQPPLPLSVDGEYVNQLDAEFAVMPNAIRVVPGAEAPALGQQDAITH